MTDEQLKLEIAHIFDSGANEIRIFELCIRYADSREHAWKDEIAALTNRNLRLRDQEENDGLHSNYTDPEAGRESGWSV
jgi:hypothetical protein